jgi:hypothetical protein
MALDQVGGLGQTRKLSGPPGVYIYLIYRVYRAGAYYNQLYKARYS